MEIASIVNPLKGTPIELIDVALSELSQMEKIKVAGPLGVALTGMVEVESP